MRKLYFSEGLGPIYYMEVEDDFNGRLNIGYNDSYEMRSQYLSKGQYHEDFEKLKLLMEKCKQKLIAEKYKELIRLMDIEFKEEDAIKHDGHYAP